VVLHESPNSPHRAIYTDGRELPKDLGDLNPTWLGDSAGHWEQDTPVVNSESFNDLEWLDVGGHPQTESLRITERLRRSDVGHLEYEMTIDDPKTFKKPFTLRADKMPVPDSVLLEDICDNERSGTHLVSGVKIAPEILAKFAYEFAPGRQAVVTVPASNCCAGQRPPGRPIVRRAFRDALSVECEHGVGRIREKCSRYSHAATPDGRRQKGTRAKD